MVPIRPGRRARALALAILTCVLAAPGRAQPVCAEGALTEACAVALALRRPELVAVFAAERAAAQATADAAGLWANPELGFEHGHVFGARGDDSEDRLVLSQRFPLSGRPGLLREAAERRAEASDLGVEARRVQVADEARRRFFTALAAQRRVERLTQALGGLEAAEAALRRRESAGDVSGYERHLMSRQSGELRVTLREAAVEATFGEERLAALVGREVKALDGALLPGDEPPPVDELIARLDERADLRALSAGASAARLELTAAERAAWPDLELGAGLKTVAVGDERATGFIVGLSLPLPVVDRGQAERAAAAGEAGRLSAAQALRRREAALALAAAHARAAALHELARDYRGGALAEARAVQDLAVRGYEAGELGVWALVEALEGRADAELRAVALALGAREARLELARVVGKGERWDD